MSHAVGYGCCVKMDVFGIEDVGNARADVGKMEGEMAIQPILMEVSLTLYF